MPKVHYIVPVNRLVGVSGNPTHLAWLRENFEPVGTLAGGRTVVLGHAGRCGLGEQYFGLAVDCRLWRRCRPLFSSLQPGAPKPEVRCKRDVPTSLATGAGQASRTTSSRSLAGASRRPPWRGRSARQDLSKAHRKSGRVAHSRTASLGSDQVARRLSHARASKR